MRIFETLLLLILVLTYRGVLGGLLDSGWKLESEERSVEESGPHIDALGDLQIMMIVMRYFSFVFC